jgi:transcriptional regulator with XRE-family HTH domain
MPDTRRPRRKTPVDHDPQALKDARIRKGLRQQDLADLAGISQSVISEAENAKRGFSPSIRVKVAKVLDADPITFAPLTVSA